MTSTNTRTSRYKRCIYNLYTCFIKFIYSIIC